MTQPTQCERCEATSTLVWLNGTWLCLDCFEKAMVKIGKTARRIRDQLSAALEGDE